MLNALGPCKFFSKWSPVDRTKLLYFLGARRASTPIRPAGKLTGCQLTRLPSFSCHRRFLDGSAQPHPTPWIRRDPPCGLVEAGGRLVDNFKLQHSEVSTAGSGRSDSSSGASPCGNSGRHSARH
ncbi:hypothetical protein VTN96DRAFT_9315 [Rasamsonia emersonii]